MPFPTDDDCLYGPLTPELLEARTVSNLKGFSVRLVDGSVPLPSRRKIAHVAMVAQRSMSRYPAGYDGTVTEDDPRLYVLAAQERAIAFVLTASDTIFWRLSWRVDHKFELLQRESLEHSGPKVGRVWVATERRRQRLSALLMEVAAEHLAVQVPALGWELPFSRDGAALVQYLLPSAFYGCCDPYTLRKAINEQAASHHAT